MRRFITPVLLDSSVSKTDFTVIPVSRSKSFRIGSEKTWSSLTYTTTAFELALRQEFKPTASNRIKTNRICLEIFIISVRRWILVQGQGNSRVPSHLQVIYQRR